MRLRWRKADAFEALLPPATHEPLTVAGPERDSSVEHRPGRMAASLSQRAEVTRDGNARGIRRDRPLPPESAGTGGFWAAAGLQPLSPRRASRHPGGTLPRAVG